MRFTDFSLSLSAVVCAALLAMPAWASGTPTEEPAAPPAPALVPEAPVRTLDVPADELADRAPAEPPPPDFTAAQFIDSAGCVFVRTPQGWRARIARDGSTICGYPSTFSARRAGPDTLEPLFREREEPRARMIERVLSEAIVPNLETDELAAPSGGDETATEPPTAAATPEPSLTQPPEPPTAQALTGKSPEPAASRPADPLGIAAAVSQTPMPAGHGSERNERLCQLIGAKPQPDPGIGGSSALGFCGSENVLASKVASLGPDMAVTLAEPDMAARGPAEPSAERPAASDTARRGADRMVPAERKAKPRSNARRAARPNKAAAPDRISVASAGKAANSAMLIPPGARYVQVGAFKDVGNAGRAAQRLAGLGLPVVRSGQGGTQLVMIGPLPGREAIVRTLDRVRRAGFRDAYAR